MRLSKFRRISGERGAVAAAFNAADIQKFNSGHHSEISMFEIEISTFYDRFFEKLKAGNAIDISRENVKSFRFSIQIFMLIFYRFIAQEIKTIE